MRHYSEADPLVHVLLECLSRARGIAAPHERRRYESTATRPRIACNSGRAAAAQLALASMTTTASPNNNNGATAALEPRALVRLVVWRRCKLVTLALKAPLVSNFECDKDTTVLST